MQNEFDIFKFNRIQQKKDERTFKLILKKPEVYFSTSRKKILNRKKFTTLYIVITILKSPSKQLKL